MCHSFESILVFACCFKNVFLLCRVKEISVPEGTFCGFSGFLFACECKYFGSLQVERVWLIFVVLYILFEYFRELVCFFLCVESNITKGNIAAILQIKTSADEIVYDGNGALLEAEWDGHPVFSFFGIVFLREGIHSIPFINIVEGVGCSFQGFICFLCLVYVFRLHYHEVAFNACDNRNLVLMFRFKLLSNLTHCDAYGIHVVSRGKYLIMAITCFLVDIGGELGIVHIGTDKPVVGTMAV